MDIQSMKIEFDDNEFTVLDILVYLKRGYGAQVNGRPFSTCHVANWVRAGKLPEAYGGNKILGLARYKELDNLAVLTIQGLSRSDVENTLGSLSRYLETKNHRRAIDTVDRRRLPRKQRTELYYKILQKAGKLNTVNTKRLSSLPENWKEIGIRENQLSGRKRQN